MDRKLRKDGTLPERVFNEFSSEIDTHSPDGLMRVRDVDRYIETALKPLFEDGKVFKRTSINQQGIRSTRYAFPGGGKIQASVKAVLGAMHEKLGYDVDPDTGNVVGTNAPPPMSVTDIRRQRYNVIDERILHPGTAAAIKAQAYRAGGASNTNKSTGRTVTIVRPGLSGVKREMMRLVDETDKKFLAGDLPSSALADGASPATIEERARAQVARQANLKDAKQAAISDYILWHPGSQLAKDMQKVTDRETRAKILAAERDPHSKEFRDAAWRRLDRRAANDDVATEWAKKNRKNPIAKAILKNRRNRTASGRMLNKALSAVKFGAWGALLTIITTAVGTMVKFLSILPGIATNVHRLAAKGAKYNISNTLMNDYEALGKVIGLDKDVFKTTQGLIHSKLSSVITGDLDGVLSSIAAVSSIGGGRAIRASSNYFKGDTDNPDPTMRAAVNDLFTATFNGRTVQGIKAKTPNGAFQANVADFDKAFGIGDLASELFSYWQIMDTAGIPEAQDIAKKSAAGGNFFELMLEYIKPISAYDIAGGNAVTRSAEVGQGYQKLKTTAGNVLEGILIKILAYMEPIVNFLEDILIGILKFLNHKVFEGQFTTQLQGMYDARANSNAGKEEFNRAQMAVVQTETTKLRKHYRLTNEVTRNNALKLIESGGVPDGMTFVEAQNFYASEKLYERIKQKDAELTSKEARSGENRVSDVSSSAYGTHVEAQVSRVVHRHAEILEDTINKYGTDPDTLKDTALNLTEKILEKERDLTARRSRRPSESKLADNLYLKSVYDGRENKTMDELNTLYAERAAVMQIVNTPELRSDTSRRAQRIEDASNARRLGEETTVKSQIVDRFRADGMLNSLITGLADGTATLSVEISPERREFSFDFKVNGEHRHSVNDVVNPNVSTTMHINDIFNSALYESPQPSIRTPDS